MKNILFITIAFCTFLTSCKKENNQNCDKTETTAKFDIVSTANSEGTAIVFKNNSSSNATTYLWDFGNGKTSTLKEPTIVYPKHGNYTITLTVTNDKGVNNTIHSILRFRY